MNSIAVPRIRIARALSINGFPREGGITALVKMNKGLNSSRTIGKWMISGCSESQVGNGGI